jgi:hypothetical protein
VQSQRWLCSFDALIGLGLQGTITSHGARFGGTHVYNPIADLGLNAATKNIVPEFYFPRVPSRISTAWNRKLADSMSVAKSGPNTVRAPLPVRSIRERVVACTHHHTAGRGLYAASYGRLRGRRGTAICGI